MFLNGTSYFHVYYKGASCTCSCGGQPIYLLLGTLGLGMIWANVVTHSTTNCVQAFKNKVKSGWLVEMGLDGFCACFKTSGNEKKKMEQEQ